MRYHTLILFVAAAVSATAQPLTLNDPSFRGQRIAHSSVPTNDAYVWFRPESIEADGSGNLTGWVDSSGNGNDAILAGAVAPTLQSNALNGQSVVLFDNSVNVGWLVSLALDIGGSNWTAITVSLKRSADDNPNTVFSRVVSLTRSSEDDFDTDDGWAAQFYTTQDFGQPGGAQAIVTYRNNTAIAVADTIYDNWHIMVSQISGAGTGLLQQDDESSIPGANDAVALGGDSIIIGNSYTSFVSDSALNGSVAEVLVWQRALTSDEIAAVVHYLRTKYGL